VPTPAERWNVDAFYSPDIASPGRSVSRFGGFLDGIDHFDCRFFGVSPREALRIDPQQRLLLQTTWEAFEDAGIAVDDLADTDTGVFVGVSYCDFAAMQGRDLVDADGHAGTGSGLSITANRISHRFGFHGPSVAIDTACSSSLVAIDLACHSLWTGQSGLAVAGGANLILSPETSVFLSKGAMLSPDGRCHSFDARANGYVRGEGVGVIVLKPLDQARADGNRIYAVIRATATNQDGHTPTITQPDRDAQVAVIREACRRARISPAEISYVEAHGTGTPVGDPIELSAIGAAIPRKSSPITVGSVKTNIGHLESASGVAGLIKAALCIRHGRIPGNLHFDVPNPAIDFAGLNVRVPVETVDWRAEADELIAGVNSFGFGGTNAHVILSECPKTEESPVLAPVRRMLFPVSAKTPAALGEVARRLLRALQSTDASAADIAGTLARRRSHLEYRALFEDDSVKGLCGQLQAFVEGSSVATTGRVDPDPRAVFVFTGQGTQWPGMGRDLLGAEPVFHDTIKTIDELFRQAGGFSILSKMSSEVDDEEIHRTEISQPLIFAVQVGLAELWKSWGIVPDAVIGHSVGEVAAAFVSGALSLGDAVTVIRHRSRLQQGLHGKGRMLVVTMPLSDVKAMLRDTPVEIAAVNSSTAITLAGEAPELEKIRATLAKRKMSCRYVNAEYAFHSRQMDPLRDELLACLADIEPLAPSISMMSTVNAAAIAAGDVAAEYWWRNVRHVVQFARGTDELIADGHKLFVEVGPHSALAGSLIESLDEAETAGMILQSMSRGEPGVETMRRTLRTLYVHGSQLAWETLNPPSLRAVALPTYPWENEAYWHEGENSRAFRFRQIVHPLLGERMPTAAAIWESTVSLNSHPYLADHELAGDTVYPGAGYIEMLLAAGRELFGDETFEVADLRFPETLYVDADRTEQFETCYDAARGTVEIHSRCRGSSESWTLKAAAVLRRAPMSSADGMWTDASFVSQETVEHERFYATLSEEHGEFGPTFRGVRRLVLAPGEARADIELPAAVSDEELACYVFHPALLDACLQCARGTISFEPDDVVINHVPVKVRRITLHKAPTRRLRIHLRQHFANDRMLRIDLAIRDDAGELVALLEDFEYLRIKRIPEASVTRKLYRTDWHPRQLGEADHAVPVAGTWVLFADTHGLACRLAAGLGESGCRTVLVSHADEFSQAGDDAFSIRCDSREDIRELLLALVESGENIRGFVHLWNLDLAAPEALSPELIVAGQRLGAVSVLHLVQEIADAGLMDRDEPPELLVVTRDGLLSGETPGDAVAHPLQSLVWGMGRVIGNELINFRCRTVDLEPGSDDIAPILSELRSGDQEPESAWRGGQRYVNRLVSQRSDQLRPKRLPARSEDGSRPFRLAMQSPGGLARITPREIEPVEPGSREIRVRVETAGLNFRDVMAALGLLPDDAEESPAWQALGLECVGIVDAVGAEVTAFGPGDRVLVSSRGAFATSVVVDAGQAMPVPGHLTAAEAATVPVAFSTAYVALVYLANIGSDDKVLVHCAAGGVGLAAVQICKLYGAEIFATAGSEEKRDYLRSLGIQHVMDSRSLDFAARIRDVTDGRGVDVVLNSLSGDFLQHSLDVLAPFGRFLEIGKRDIYSNNPLGMKAFARSIRFFGVDCAKIFRARKDLARQVMRDLMDLFDANRLQPLPLRTYRVSRAEDAFRDMSQARHIGKLILDFDDPDVQIVSRDSVAPVSADGNYLVTGGTSGFGLRVARWLADQGAGGIVLASRSGTVRAGDAAAFEALASSGSEVQLVACDVSSAESVRALIAGIDTAERPLKGVFHAAALFDDAVIFNMSRENFEKVLEPKVAGGWNLHRATLDLPLELFVLFSSLSADFGTPGQINYAAANAFLNGLARYRRARGLPVLAINFGSLGETGFIARNQDVSRLLGNLGVEELDIDSALESLGLLLASDVTEMTVASINWMRLSASSADVPLQHRLSLLLESREDAAPDHRHRIMQELATVAPEQAISILETFLRHEVARILGMRFDAVEIDRPLQDLGLDSLAVFELKNSLEFAGFLKIPLSKLKTRPTIANIARLVFEYIHESKDAGADAKQQQVS